MNTDCQRPFAGLVMRTGAVLALLLGLFLPASSWAQSAGSPQVLSAGTSVTGLSGAQNSTRYFSLSVPPGATSMSLSITGSSGDADLYLRYGSVPTLTQWDQRPYTPASNESVTVANPRSGTWYVMVQGYASYSNLSLRAQLSGGTAAVAATPTFSPSPGSFSGQVAVSLASATPNAVLRYTLNGSTPTASSEVYIAPIVVNQTTQVRAAAFAAGRGTSAVAAGTYTITNAVQTLANNTPVGNLSGAQGNLRNFKFAVPAGISALTISMTGSSGDADLYVKYGQLATTSVWDQRPFVAGSNETVTINAPRAGDYYILVHAYAAYSGLTLRAATTGAATGGKPDLAIDATAFNPFITTQTFGPNDCEIQEGTITAGTKKLLRFTTKTQNLGTADLVLGNPASSASFEFGSCHGHYHFRSFAQYRLLDRTGALVRTGKKVGFCLMDITRNNASANPAARYDCSNQGIQAGWADIYSANLSGQWIDITGLPAGAYILEVTIDPMNLIDELNETNNTVRANVTIP